MDSETILEIAETWSYWDREVPPSIPRDVDLPDQLPNRVAIIIQGVRRCGKSTLLAQLLDRYAINPEHAAFINFEDPRLASSLSYETLDALVSAFNALHPNASRRVYFLDETQWVSGWERWLRTKLERPGNDHYVVTGSNTHLLSAEASRLMTGRHLTTELFPFSLEEFQKPDANRSLADYLRCGGFPEPLAMTDGDRLLRQYFSDILESDIRERVGARSSQPLRQLIQMVFEAAGSEVSLRQLSAACGIAVDTVAGYLESSEQAYLLFACPYFAWSEKKRSRRNKKYYPVDPGLRRIAITRTGGDCGKALECVTYIALRQRFRDVSYWRGKREVDFVVDADSGPRPIQVTWDGPKEHHERAIEEFFERFPHAGEPVFVTAENYPEVLERLDR